MAAHTADEYRQSFLGSRDDLLNRCLFYSGILGTLFLVIVMFTPVRDHAITEVSQLPKRFAELIIKKKVVPAPVPTTPDAVPSEEPEAIEQPKPVEPKPVPRRREVKPDPNAGQVGRERAQKEITQELASTQAALQSTLDDLSSSLSSSSSQDARPKRKRRSRGVRSGRSSSEMAKVETGLGAGVAADLSGSQVEGTSIAVGTIAPTDLAPSGDGTAAADDPSATGAAPGVYRSNASLLAVIQKYAAGIQYCYANELKRDDSLRGKLVVSMTISASGNVMDATVVQNTLGSKRLEDCALAQIRDWKFPPIAEGVTSFQAPFVFTPPK